MRFVLLMIVLSVGILLALAARIKREHASGRFPFLVSSLCRDFLQRFASSPHRAEVEQILTRNQDLISKEALLDSAGDKDRSLIKREDLVQKKPATDRQGP